MLSSISSQLPPVHLRLCGSTYEPARLVSLQGNHQEAAVHMPCLREIETRQFRGEAADSTILTASKHVQVWKRTRETSCWRLDMWFGRYVQGNCSTSSHGQPNPPTLPPSS